MSEVHSRTAARRGAPRKFDDSFKQHAVALVVDQGRRVKDVAQDLGISPYLLYEWRRRLRPKGGPPAALSAVKPRSQADLESENAALRRELDYVRQQRDILKKTLGILSEPSSNGTSGSRR